MQIPQEIAQLLSAIRKAGGRPIVVGGAVRDHLLGIPVKDLDIEVYGLSPTQLEQALAARGKVDAVGKAFGVLKVAGIGADFSLPELESDAPAP